MANYGFWLGWAQEVAGDHATAQESWRQARSELESFLKEQPENQLLIGDLALTNMGLGDNAAAFKLVERAMAVLPIEKDALDGPASVEIHRPGSGPDGATRSRHRRFTETTLHTVRRRVSFKCAAHSRAAPARSDVRSAPERSALPKTLRRKTKVISGNFFAELRRRNV